MRKEEKEKTDMNLYEKNALSDSAQEETGKAGRKRKMWMRFLAIVLAAVMILSTVYVGTVNSFWLTASGDTAGTSSKKKITTEYAVQQMLQNMAADPDYQEKLKQQQETSYTGEQVLSMANDAMEKEDYQAAETYYGSLIDAGEKQLYKMRAICRYKQNEYAGMLEDCRSYFDAGFEDTDGSAYLMEAAGYMYQTDYRNAETALNSAIAAGYSDSHECYIQLVRCNFVLEEYDSVIENADKVLSDGTGDSDSNAEIRYYRAISYASKGQLPEAQEDLKYVIDTTSDSSLKSSASEFQSQIQQALQQSASQSNGSS